MTIKPILPAGANPERRKEVHVKRSNVGAGFKAVLQQVLKERGESEALWFVQNSSPELPPGVSSASELLALLLEGK